MTIDEAITRYENNADYERTHGNLQGYLEFRQLVEWLSNYKKIEQIYQKWNEANYFSYNEAMQKIGEVLEDGNDD